MYATVATRRRPSVVIVHVTRVLRLLRLARRRKYSDEKQKGPNG